MLDVRRLRLLRELHIRGTIAAVAEALSFTPSAVSQQLAALEREVGAPLLRRQGRRVVLTPAAVLLAERTGGILDALERAEHDVAASAGKPVGTVRMVTFQSATLAFVPPLLRLLARRHPLLRLELEQHEPESALWHTFAGDFDLVVAEEYPDHAAPHHPGLDRVPLGVDGLRLAVPADWPGSSLADAAADAWVMEPRGAASRHWSEQRCRIAGFEPDARFETADLRTHARLIEEGHAVGIVSDLMLRDAGAGLRVIALDGDPARRLFTAARIGHAAGAEIAAVRAALAELAATRLAPAG